MKSDFIWASEEFVKEKWGEINYLIGPNGTGKSLFIEELLKYYPNPTTIRYVNSEKLSGLEKYEDIGSISSSNLREGIRFDLSMQGTLKELGKRGYPIDLLIQMKEKPELLIKIQTILSQYFGRRIQLEIGGGYLNLKINSNYDFRKGESHGLKSLILILAAIYEKDKQVLILDEPELHFHPQLQEFMIETIRKQVISGDKKQVFIATHSPFIVDIRTLNDLKNCIFFRPNRKPVFVGDSLNNQSEHRLIKLLPSLNSNNKQFFFANFPIFLEGFADRNIYSLILEKSGLPIGANGSSLIDLGGRNKLDLYFNICNTLGINAKFVLDLDAMFDKSIVQLITEEQTRHGNAGIPSFIDLGQKIRSLEFDLDRLSKSMNITRITSKYPKLYAFKQKYNLELSSQNFKLHYALTKAIMTITDDLELVFPEIREKIKSLTLSIKEILNVFRCYNFFLLPKGELEDYYVTSETDEKGRLTSKSDRFAVELDHLTDIDNESVMLEYKDLNFFFKQVLKLEDPNFIKTINYHLIEWIHLIQKAYKENPTANTFHDLSNDIPLLPYDELWEVVDFNNDPINNTFHCIIRLKIFAQGKPIIIDNLIVPADYVITD